MNKLNRKETPAIKDPIHYSFQLKPYTHYLLANGIPVYSIHAGSQEVLQIELVYSAGNCFEKKKGLAAATNFLLKNGTSTLNAFQLNEAFEYYGAYCNRSCYNETAMITLHTLSKHVVKMLPLLKVMLSDSLFLPEELEIYKQNSKQRLKVNKQKADFVATRLIDSSIYGSEHPYGVYTEPEDLDAITVEDCRQFYNDHYLKGHCKIFVCGNLPDNMSLMLNEVFGKLQNVISPLALPDMQATPAQEKKYRIENDPKAVQGAIRIASPFPNRHHPDFQKVIVLNTLFGGFFGSRLMSNIREIKGYTYGIYSYLQNHLQQSAWVISTEAGKKVCEATINEVYLEMKALRENTIEEEELLLVRNYMLGNILGELDGPFHLMAKWKNIILNNLDENYFYDSVETIKTVTATELKTLAVKYMQPELFYELVVY